MYIIAGLFRHRRIVTPKSNQTRPTANRLREALFNICQHAIEGAHFLDLFAGSGAMGFEALSRGAASVTFIENNKEALRCIQLNAATLQVESQVTILQGNVFVLLGALHKQQRLFDIIYADPPYETYLLSQTEPVLYSEQIIQLVDTSSILQPNGLLFVEEDFAHQPTLDHLQSLQLKNSRRAGKAVLQQYVKVNA